MIDVLEIVASIEADKKSRNVFPSHALFSEIISVVASQVRSELKQGVSDDKLTWCKTINSYGFSTKK